MPVPKNCWRYPFQKSQNEPLCQGAVYNYLRPFQETRSSEIPDVAAQGSHFFYTVCFCVEQPAGCGCLFLFRHTLESPFGTGCPGSICVRLVTGCFGHDAALVEKKQCASQRLGATKNSARYIRKDWCVCRKLRHATPWTLTSPGFCWVFPLRSH